MNIRKMTNTLAAVAALTMICRAHAADGLKYYEYLSGGKDGYIDSGVVVQGDMRYEAEIAWTAKPDDDGVLGVKDGNDLRYYIFYGDSSGYWKIAGGGLIESTSCPIVVGKKVKAECQIAEGDRYLKIDGETIWTKTTSGPVTSTAKTHYIMAYNYNGSVWGAAPAKLYSLKIWRKNEQGEYELIRNYLPASQTTDGATVYGLYDFVEKKMYASSAFGRSSVGTQIVLPGMSRQELAYVDASGSSYVDTGVYAKTGLEAELDILVRSTGDTGVLAAHYGNNWENRVYLAAINGVYRIGYGSGLESSVSVKVNQRVNWHSRLWDGEQWLDLNGERIVDKQVTGTVDAGTTLALFSHGGATMCSSVRLYRGKIWQYDAVGQTNVLVRDFIPSRIDGDVGLFDAVNNTFYVSGSATPLVAGPDVKTPKYRLAYVESTGTASIDTGIAAKAGVEAEAEVEWTASPSDNYILAAKNSSGTRMFMIGGQSSGGNKWCFSYGNNYFSELVEVGHRYQVYAKMEAGSQVLKLDGVEKLNLNVANEYDLGLNLFAFAANISKPQCYAKARIYAMKIRVKDADGNYQLARDFVPAQSHDGAIGLWDRVTRQLFTPTEVAATLTTGDDKTPWTGFNVIVK